MGPRSSRDALVFILLGLMIVKANSEHISPSVDSSMMTQSKVEGVTSPPIPSPASEPDIQNRVVLSIANGLSLALSLSPFYIRWVYGSWSITREIFPAKGVACNLVASVTWTVYMMFQMYVQGNYAGEDVLLVNSVTITSSVYTLLTYFLNGREHIKFWILKAVFIIMVCCGMGWLVWHPNIILSSKTQDFLANATRHLGIAGTIFFGLVNILPFADLCAMTWGDKTDFTLLMPVMINTFLCCFVDGVWALYAWVFDPKHPNYFMIANVVAAVMAFVQGAWVLILRIRHREVVGQITDIESLRSVLLSVAKSLERLGADKHDKAFWTRNYLVMLQESLNIGWQSLSLLESVFSRLEVELVEKSGILAADTADKKEAENGRNKDAISKADNAKIRAKSALAMCTNVLTTCRDGMEAFDDMIKAIKTKLALAPNVQEAGGRDSMQNPTQSASKFTSALADNLRYSLQFPELFEEFVGKDCWCTTEQLANVVEVRTISSRRKRTISNNCRRTVKSSSKN